LLNLLSSWLANHISFAIIFVNIDTDHGTPLRFSVPTGLIVVVNWLD
jgi:hypothetical protein